MFPQPDCVTPDAPTTGKLVKTLDILIIPFTSLCLQGIFTILRDRSARREDFIFFTDRLATFLSEKAMEFLPYKPKTITTPVGSTYVGKQLTVEVRAYYLNVFRADALTFIFLQHVCGVSILRS